MDPNLSNDTAARPISQAAAGPTETSNTTNPAIADVAKRVNQLGQMMNTFVKAEVTRFQRSGRDTAAAHAKVNEQADQPVDVAPLNEFNALFDQIHNDLDELDALSKMEKPDSELLKDYSSKIADLRGAISNARASINQPFENTRSLNSIAKNIFGSSKPKSTLTQTDKDSIINSKLEALRVIENKVNRIDFRITNYLINANRLQAVETFKEKGSSSFTLPRLARQNEERLREIESESSSKTPQPTLTVGTSKVQVPSQFIADFHRSVYLNGKKLSIGDENKVVEALLKAGCSTSTIESVLYTANQAIVAALSEFAEDCLNPVVDGFRDPEIFLRSPSPNIDIVTSGKSPKVVVTNKLKEMSLKTGALVEMGNYIGKLEVSNFDKKNSTPIMTTISLTTSRK